MFDIIHIFLRNNLEKLMSRENIACTCNTKVVCKNVYKNTHFSNVIFADFFSQKIQITLSYDISTKVHTF